MDMQKVGGFLRELRKARGVTQEQVAERLGVAGRTVSRWETAACLPDLDMLLQLAEFYHVEIRELLNGEQQKKSTGKDANETLRKLVDLSRLERERAAGVGLAAFCVTFFTCATVLLLQLLRFMDIRLIAGEAVVWTVGGVSMLVMTVREGLWELFSGGSRKTVRDVAVSAVCAALFAVLELMLLSRIMQGMALAVLITAGLFLAQTALGYLVIRLCAGLSHRRSTAL